MSNEVSVRFGASLTQLIAGVNQAKEAIESIKESTDRVTEGFKTIAEIAGVSLSIEGVKSFVESMAELGDKTEHSMARLGESAEQITLLQGVAKMSGTDFEGLQLAIEKASLSVQKSTQNSFSPAAQALKVLGLSAQSLVGLPADQWFLKVAEAVSKFNPSLNLTNAVTAAFGRNAAQMLPMLLGGAERFREMEAAVRAAQDGLAAAIPGMADTHEKLSLMSLSVQSLGARIFSVLKPAIDSAVTSFTKWVQSIDTATIISAVQKVTNVIISLMEAIGNFAIQVGGYIDNLGISLDEFAKKMSLIATGVAAGGVLGAFAGGIGALPGAALGGAVGAGVDQIRQWFEGYDKVATDGEAKMAARKASLESLVSATRAVFDSMTKNFGHPEEKGSEGGKQNAGAIDAGAQGRVAAQVEAINAQIALADRAFQSQVEQINSLARVYGVGEDQKTEALLTALETRHNAEMMALAQESEIRGLSEQQHQKMLEEQEKLDQKYAADRQRIMDRAFQGDVREWESVLQPIQSAWDSQLHGLLAGTETWGEAMRNIFASLTMDVIKELEKVALQKAAIGLATTFGQGPQSFLGSLFGGGQAVSQTENTSALGTLTAAVIENTIALGGETAATTTATAADAASGAGGIAGFFKGLMSFLPAFDTGSWNLPATTMAVVHQGEMIVPAGPAAGLRQALSSGGGAGGGAGGITINMAGFTGTQAMINQIIPQLAQRLSSYRNLNPSVAGA